MPTWHGSRGWAASRISREAAAGELPCALEDNQDSTPQKEVISFAGATHPRRFQVLTCEGNQPAFLPLPRASTQSRRGTLRHVPVRLRTLGTGTVPMRCHSKATHIRYGHGTCMRLPTRCLPA